MSRPDQGAGELTALVAKWRKRGEDDTASGKLENSWVLECADELEAILALYGFAAKKELDTVPLAAKAPQGVPIRNEDEIRERYGDAAVEMLRRHHAQPGHENCFVILGDLHAAEKGLDNIICNPATLPVPHSPLPVVGPVSDDRIHHGMVPPVPCNDCNEKHWYDAAGYWGERCGRVERELNQLVERVGIILADAEIECGHKHVAAFIAVEKLRPVREDVTVQQAIFPIKRVLESALTGTRPSSEGGGLAANPGYPAPESTGGPQKMTVLPVPVPVSDDTIHHGIFPPRVDRNGLMGPSSDALWSKAYNEGIKYGRSTPAPARPEGCICSEAYGVGPEQCGRHATAHSSDWCDDCKAPQMVTGDGAHHCGEAPAPGAERPMLEDLPHKIANRILTDDHGSSFYKWGLGEIERLVREALAAAPPATCECGRAKRLVCEHCFGNGAADYARHASAERVRQLEAALSKAQKIIQSELERSQQRGWAGWIAEIERALLPSTGEKHDGE